MGWNVRFWYGPNLLIRDEVLFNCAIAFNGSGRHERGVSRRGLGRILCYYFLLARGAIREISVRGTEIGETAWIIERSRLQ